MPEIYHENFAKLILVFNFMKEISQNCKHIFKSFAVAFDIGKILIGSCWFVLSLFGIQITFFLLNYIFSNELSQKLCIWNLQAVISFIKNSYLNNTVQIVFILNIIWMYTIWCIFGGALYRMSAVELASNKRISFREALKFSKNHFWTFFKIIFVLLLPLLILSGINAGAGFLTALLKKYVATIAGNLFIGFIWFILVGISFFIVVIILTILFTPGLIFAAIAVDKFDHYDSVSRGITYFFHQFWNFIVYHLIAFLYALIKIIILIGFAIASWQVTMFFVKWALNQEIQEIWNLLLYLYIIFFAGFAISFYTTIKTAIYSVLRYLLKQTPLSDYGIE